jgi:tetratricopeptide (TPR) repeat protein
MAEGTDHGRHAPQGDSALLAATLGTLAGSPRIETLIERQIALADLQIEDIKRDDRLRRWSLRTSNASAAMKVAFELAVAFVFLVIAVVVAGAIWSAHKAQGLVIESFEVPVAMAERGLSGQVVASRLLDKLAGLQDQTDSLRAASSYANNWGDDIKVQIPDTGVSIGEFNRYLRQWLGHETHITGEVWREGDGIAVVARAGADQGVVFTGKEGDLDALLQKAAEAVYEKTQAYRYAVYLLRTGNVEKAKAVIARIIATATPAEQAWAYSLSSNDDYNTGRWRDSIAKNTLAVGLDPDNALAYENRAEVERDTGQDEAAFGDFRKALALVDGGRADINPQKVKPARLFARTQVLVRLGDFAQAAQLLDEIERTPSYAGSRIFAPLYALGVYGAVHDVRGLRQHITARTLDAGGDPSARFWGQGFLLMGAALAGDNADALRAHDALVAQSAGLAFANTMYLPRAGAAYYALALAQSGDFAKADAVIAPTPADCDICTRMRGRIAALEKHWDRAEFWFARYAAQAPDMPFAMSDWGRMLLARGDAAGAIAKFQAAREKGPRFADPLEGWGEALVMQNRSDLALEKFAEAAKYAPNWDRLRREWAAARRYAGTNHG